MNKKGWANHFSAVTSSVLLSITTFKTTHQVLSSQTSKEDKENSGGKLIKLTRNKH